MNTKHYTYLTQKAPQIFTNLSLYSDVTLKIGYDIYFSNSQQVTQLQVFNNSLNIFKSTTNAGKGVAYYTIKSRP